VGNTTAHILQYSDTYSAVLRHIMQYSGAYSAVLRHIFCSTPTYFAVLRRILCNSPKHTLQYSETHSAVFYHIFCRTRRNILQYSDTYMYSAVLQHIFSNFKLQLQKDLDYFFFVLSKAIPVCTYLPSV
jgi:hypothetical protein